MVDFGVLVNRFRRYPDPAASADPLIRTIVGQLRALPVGPAISTDFRDELRAQLVAVTPRLVAEGVTEPATESPRHGFEKIRAGAGRIPMRRPLTVVGTLLVVFVMLLAGAVWMSSRTLPGDSLYGLKRASENVQLSLTGGAGARGRQYLTLANKRANEASALLARASASAAGLGPQAAGGPNAHTAKLVSSTLRDADSDSRNGSRLLTGQAVHNMSVDPLTALTTWAPAQITRLGVITSRIPAGPLHDQAVASRQLAQRVLDRATQLRTDLGCSCLSGTSTDDLGPMPCHTACNPVVPTSPSQTPSTSPPSSGPPSRSQTSSPGRTSGRTTGAPTPRSGSASGGPSGSRAPTTAPGGSTGNTSRVGAPTLTGSPPPTGGGPLPSPPVTIDTCGLHITLGPIGAGLGSCGINLHL